MDDPASNFLALLVGDHFSVILVKFLTKFAAVLLLVAANGFFVGAEFALVSVRRPRLEARAAAGSRRAHAALRLLGNPTLVISANCCFVGTSCRGHRSRRKGSLRRPRVGDCDCLQCDHVLAYRARRVDAEDGRARPGRIVGFVCGAAVGDLRPNLSLAALAFQ